MQVLAESEQIRREADNIGPRAELDYWKRRMTKFNFLLDQIKSQSVRGVLTILQTAKSKLLQVVPILLSSRRALIRLLAMESAGHQDH